MPVAVGRPGPRQEVASGKASTLFSGTREEPFFTTCFFKHHVHFSHHQNFIHNLNFIYSHPQNELIKNVRALRRPREPAPESATEPGAAGAAEPGARERKWRGVVCAHGQRRYRCRHADCIEAGKERAAKEPPRRARVSETLEKHQQVSSAQLRDELSVLKGQITDIASALRPSP
jgi:hypothetical protein